jgi:hypothetical protein
MSQVHNVTYVPVHSPLSEACLPYECAKRTELLGRDVAGKNETVTNTRLRVQKSGFMTYRLQH